MLLNVAARKQIVGSAISLKKKKSLPLQPFRDRSSWTVLSGRHHFFPANMASLQHYCTLQHYNITVRTSLSWVSA